MTDNSLSIEFVRCLIEQADQAVIKTIHCVEQLSDSQIWTRPEDSLNSTGNLIVHIEGNLRQWGVVSLTGEADRRDREKEFSQTANIPRSELVSRLETVVDECRTAWLACDTDRLLTRVQVQGFEVSVCEALLHTVAHFVGHTHQIIFLCRQFLGEQYRFHWSPDLPRGQVPL